MKRRLFLQSLSLAMILSGAAMAQDFATDVVHQLAGQGYADISVETTFLGRVRILAYAKDGYREIILNPRTGEILRDLWVAASGASPRVSIVNNPGSDSGSGSGSNSGSGSGSDDDGGGSGSNSGPGSGDDEDRDEDRDDDRDEDREDREDRD